MRNAPRILIFNETSVEALKLKEMLHGEEYDDIVIANNGEDALAIVQSSVVDLILIKITREREGDALETAKNIQAIKQMPIIYLSDFLNEQTIAKARKTSPSAFIVKPFLADQISIAIGAALCIPLSSNGKIDLQKENGFINAISTNVDGFTKNEAIYVKENYKFIKIVLSDILYLQADNNYTFMFNKDRKFVIRKTMQSLLDTINYKQFIRVHRSYVVNVLHITSFDEAIILVGNKEIPLSRNYKDTFSENFTIL